MSKAPEWIYLDGDVEAGDGMFPRCFEDPKYASEPPIEYGRIDLLEAAEQRAYANAMEAERKLHEGRIEELEAKNARLETEAKIQAEEIDKTHRRADKWQSMVLDCEEYLKFGETPVERIEREINDCLALMKLLEKK